MNPLPESILVVSCGNTMAGNDAFGPRVTQLLREDSIDRVQVIDLDIRPMALMDFLPNQQGLILIDAAVADQWPSGTLLDLDWFDPNRPELQHDDALSTHGLSLAHQIKMAARLDLLPPVVRLISVIIQPTRVGDKMGNDVRSAVPKAAQCVRDRVKSILTGNRETCHA
jgi:hydrogenase maturation protease